MHRYRSLAGVSAVFQAVLSLDPVRCTGLGKRPGSDMTSGSEERNAEVLLRLRRQYASAQNHLQSLPTQPVLTPAAASGAPSFRPSPQLSTTAGAPRSAASTAIVRLPPQLSQTPFAPTPAMLAQFAANTARINDLRQLSQPLGPNGARTAVHVSQLPPPSNFAAATTSAGLAPSTRPNPTQQPRMQASPSTPQPSRLQSCRRRQRQRQYKQYKGRDFTSDADVSCHSLGACNVVCPHCSALHWSFEQTDGTNAQPLFGMCCTKGSVQLQPLRATPSVLATLLSTQSPRGKQFRDNIRKYNVCLAMASSGECAYSYVKLAHAHKCCSGFPNIAFWLDP